MAIGPGTRQILALFGQREQNLFAVPPSDIGHFEFVDVDVGCERLGVAADHQGRRERPRLRGVVSRRVRR